MELNKKYPRTYHLPFSPGTTSDDKKLSADWFENYAGKEVVITEKMDGENTSMNSQDVYARSHGAPTRHPWSLNLWDQNNGLYWRIRPLLSETEMIYGENMYGVHSIEYDKLPAYWFMFAANNGERWYSWNEVEEMAKILDVPTVPILWRGIAESEKQITELIMKFVGEPSVYGSIREGIVMRTAESFQFMEDGQEAFPFHVCKWVRPHHVQTDVHWTRNWKRAKLLTDGNV
jgi:ATP-dependent RNA circularization protein (DNA/RNA ligase family)